MAGDSNEGGERDTEEIRRDIEDTREQAGQTLDEITERVRPEHVYRRQRAQLQERADRVRRSAEERARAAVEGVPVVPVAGGLLAIGGLGSVVELRRRRRRKRTAAGWLQRGASPWSAGAVVAVVLLAKAVLARRSRRAVAVAVGDVMTPDPDFVRDVDTLATAARKMAALDVGALPVCGLDDRLVGVLTDRDITVKAVAEGRDPERMSAVELVAEEPATVSPLDPVEEAVRTMARHSVRRLPVVEGGRLVGIVTQADLAVHIGDAEVGALLERISAAP